MASVAPGLLPSLAIAAATGASVALLIRSLSLFMYRKWFLQGPVWDSAFHLAVIRTLKRKGRYDGVDEFLMKNKPDTYPIAFHRYAALFPRRWIEDFPFLPNLLMYVTSSASYVAYLHYVGTSFFGRHALEFTLIAAAFHFFSISNITFNGNAILYLSLAERQLGRIVCAWYFLTLSFALGFQDPVSFVLAVLSGGLAGISSMFARQAIGFVTPLIALYLWDVTPMIVLTLAFLVALAVDRSYFLRGLGQMAEFWKAYVRFTKRSNWVKPSLSRLVDLSTIFGRGRSVSQRIAELEGKEPTRLLFAFPELFLLFALYSSGPVPEARHTVAIILATLTVYLLTSLKILNHFGEALRYVEFNLYLLLPAAIAICMPGSEAGIGPTALAVYCVWAALIVLRQLILWARIPYPRKDELAEFLKPLGIGASDTVFPIPFTLGPGVSVRTSCRAITYQGSAVNVALYEKFTEEVPFLKRDWSALFAEHQVTHVVALALVVNSLKDYLGWEYDFGSLVKIAESKEFVAYRTTAAPMLVPARANV